MSAEPELKLNHYAYAQRERLAYIDFVLQYQGSIARGELMEHFGTAVASGTRDFTLYRELAPDNLALRHENKRYYRTDHFKPLFHHDSHTALNTLAHGFGDGMTSPRAVSGFCEDTPDLIAPPRDTLATLSRAISQGQAVKLIYISLSSGGSQRVIVPHSIVNNGQRWHVRGYCRKHSQFRDFVCTRITDIRIDHTEIAPAELQAADTEWNQQLTLELVPHPGHDFPEAIALDFNMSLADTSTQKKQPIRRLTIRAARAGYLLRHWNVDCSSDHRLPADECHLWLRNHEILKQCSNAVLAPGYATDRRGSPMNTKVSR
ncbi:transcriptional regulator [Shewanella chilikensis]|uniref:transcriptional regulator n=1 Tax=Shewanella chilikensis TaxID=558541 RepID=UPI0030CF27ED